MTTAYPGKEGGPTAVVTVKLQRSIPNADGESVDEISFREPAARDLMQVGNPIKVDMYSGPAPTVTIIDEKMGPMLARLSLIPQAMIERMHPQDFVQCGWELAGFFLPAGLMRS